MRKDEAIDIIKCLAWHTRPDEEDVEQAIKALEQEPKTGYWEEWKNYLNLPSAIAYSCSKCSAFVHEKTNFCPDCGARMIKKVRKYE